VSMSDYVQVTTAAETQEAAAALVRSAVKAHLAGSGQVLGPVKSFFWHLDEYGEGEEYKVVLMTTMEGYEALEKHLIEQHEWENPEITAVPLAAGSAAYLGWLKETVAEKS
jgi:periplasmic divalent cation tolerance protein